MSSSFNIKVQNLDPILKNLDKLARKKVEQVRDELQAFGLGTVADAQRRVPVDEGRLKNSITYTLKGLTVEVIVAANYAAYMEFGTRKFAERYVSSLPSDWQTFAAKFKGASGGSFELMVQRITEWVSRKGIDKEAAYPIALKILREGVKQHPFLYPSYEKNKKELIENLKKLI